MAIKASDLFYTYPVQGGRRWIVKQKGRQPFCVAPDDDKANLLVALLNNNLDKLKVEPKRVNPLLKPVLY